MNTHPPCWPAKTPCPNDCAAALLQRVVYNHQDLTGPWAGWKFRGRELVSPTGTRLSPARIEGLAWKQMTEARLDAVRARNAAKSTTKQLVKVVVVDLGEYRENGLAVG